MTGNGTILDFGGRSRIETASTIWPGSRLGVLPPFG
jgi:hypothetical protein